jgi:hypothetical protein
MGNAFFVFNIWFKSLQLELKGYSTRVRSKKEPLFQIHLKNKYTFTYY